MEDQDRNYADECGDHGGRNSRGEPCGRAAGWGTPDETGKCRRHRGTSPDGSSHEGNDFAEGNDGGDGAEEDNTRAVTHGAYADQSNLYSQVFDDVERQVADDIFADYRDRYEAIHGDLIYGHRVRLFKISVNAVTEIRVENWVTQKPEDLESGTTWIDEETRIKTTQDRVVEETKYKKSPALAAKKTLSNENRKWLKDLDLLGADEINVDVSGEVDHNHEHGLDEATEQIIDDLADDLKA
jgi:hypothetical protein